MAKAVKINREPKVWVCIDDGTQKNFFFASNHGEKSRREPDSFEYETLDNGERKFYFKGFIQISLHETCFKITKHYVITYLFRKLFAVSQLFQACCRCDG